MTTIDPAPSMTGPADAAAVAPAALWDRFEALLERAGDRLNPILVKEARQALRSRQFVITFFLMLAAGWLWSIVGLASIGPAVYYTAEGPQMLFVYHLILSFPLLVVAPYAAFHSLSSERNDRTYELLSITALGARQILSGKLCAIALQMIVYLSAIFPCLAFTYLLRGLDIFTILLVVAYTCGLSLALSVTGLLLGAIAPLRQRHIGLSVVLALVLFGAFWMDNLWTSQIVYFGGMTLENNFWAIQFVFLTLFLNYFAVVFLAARSQLLTVSENRSTALRWALVVAQLSFVTWIAWGQMTWGGDELMFVLVYFSAVGWFAAGMFLTGESAVLSPRVKRDLPQSTLARWLFTWFTPGPGTGYMLVIVNLLAVSLLALLPYNAIAERVDGVVGFSASYGSIVRNTVNFARRPGPDAWDVFGAAVVATSYVIIYLGIASLIVRAIRRYTEVRLPVPVVINVLLLMLGCLTPWVAQMTMTNTRNTGWTLLQVSNPAWTLSKVCFDSIPYDMPALVLGLSTMAAVVWLLNLPPLLDDLKQVRIAKPERVEEEDAERAALLATPSGPKSPWDTDDAEGA